MAPFRSWIVTCLLGLFGAAAGSASAQDPTGDPHRGEALFTGSARFEGQGAPCLACHGVSGHGLARAASFGPDLTETFATYGLEMLDTVLADVPFPSMEPLYAGRGITPAERADLAAFLRDAGARSPTRLGAGYAAGVVVIGAAFAAAFLLVGRRRSGSHREAP